MISSLKVISLADDRIPPPGDSPPDVARMTLLRIVHGDGGEPAIEWVGTPGVLGSRRWINPINPSSRPKSIGPAQLESWFVAS